MPSDQPTGELEEWIARQEELLADLGRHAERLKEIRHRASQQNLKSGIPKSQFLRIAEYLLSVDNRPRSTRAILRNTGVTRSSLSQILHRTHKESFVSTPIPGYTRKKKWSLTIRAAKDAKAQLDARNQRTLFDTGDLAGVKAVDCCAKILRDHGNDPMNALTMAREAIARGYRGKSQGSEDEVLLTTAKSFWAALGRDSRFEEVRPLVFALKDESEGN